MNNTNIVVNNGDADQISRINFINMIISQYALGIIWLMGNIGSVLTCIVFYQPTFRKSACSMYFTASSISQLLAFNFALLYRMLQYVSGLKGTQAISFTTSSSSYLQATGFRFLSYNNAPFSISLWIQPILLQGTIVGSSLGYDPLTFASNGSLIARVATVSVSYDILLELTPIWSHIVLTWSSSGGLNLYINNILVKSALPSTSTGSGASTNNLILGGGSFSGAIDEWRLYSRELPSISGLKGTQAISFTTSSSSYLQATGFRFLSYNNAPFSISLWIQPILLQGTIVGSSLGYDPLTFASNGSLIARVATVSVSYNILLELTPIWSHIVLTWSSSGGLNLYINNILVKSALPSTSTGSGASTNNLILGGGSFSGTIDEWRLYSRELPSSDICAIFTN
ncbi:unnamed protein product [Adineta steineri]|uniref:Uncharacterized protein n=1 Tax=Adineta steineri TaxID=433720 RepID=A0A814JWN5_9BILA|nr:unnamed protein product [Adineta steineri]